MAAASALRCSEPGPGGRQGFVDLLQAVGGLVVLLAQIRDAELLSGDLDFDGINFGAGGRNRASCGDPDIIAGRGRTRLRVTRRSRQSMVVL